MDGPTFRNETGLVAAKSEVIDIHHHCEKNRISVVHDVIPGCICAFIFCEQVMSVNSTKGCYIAAERILLEFLLLVCMPGGTPPASNE